MNVNTIYYLKYEIKWLLHGCLGHAKRSLGRVTTLTCLGRTVTRLTVNSVLRYIHSFFLSSKNDRIKI